MKNYLLILIMAIGLFGCKKNTTEPTPEPEFFVNEDPATFAETGSIVQQPYMMMPAAMINL